MEKDWIGQSLEKRKAKDEAQLRSRDSERLAEEALEAGIVPVWGFVMDQLRDAIDIANKEAGEPRITFKVHPQGFGADWAMNAGESVVGNLEIEERNVNLIYFLDGGSVERDYEIFVDGTMIQFRNPEGRVVSQASMAREILERFINPE